MYILSLNFTIWIVTEIVTFWYNNYIVNIRTQRQGQDYKIGQIMTIKKTKQDKRKIKQLLFLLSF